MILRPRPLRIVMTAVLIPVGAAAFSGCADSTNPAEPASAGRFTLRVNGPTVLDLEGTAFPTPSPTNGLLEKIRMIAVTPARGYTLDIAFAPPVTFVEGLRNVAPDSATKATFTVFDRIAGEYLEIADAQSGTLTLGRCSLSLRCPGTFTGRFFFRSDSMSVTITASFDARLQTR